MLHRRADPSAGRPLRSGAVLRHRCAAVASAAERNKDRPNVRIEQRVLPADWPEGTFDLIVASEFLYYFGGDELAVVIDLCGRALRPGGTLLAVHWRHPVPEYPRSGDSVHEALAARDDLALIAGHTEPDFIAEAYLRGTAAISVAQSTGLL